MRGYVYKTLETIIDYSPMQGGRGHLPVYYTSPQSFMITFYYSLVKQLWGLLLNFDLFLI